MIFDMKPVLLGLEEGIHDRIRSVVGTGCIVDWGNSTNPKPVFFCVFLCLAPENLGCVGRSMSLNCFQDWSIEWSSPRLCCSFLCLARLFSLAPRYITFLTTFCLFASFLIEYGAIVQGDVHWMRFCIAQRCFSMRCSRAYVGLQQVRDEIYEAFENIYPVLTEFRKVQQW